MVNVNNSVRTISYLFLESSVSLQAQFGIPSNQKKCCCTPLMCLSLCHLSRCETEERHPSLGIWCGLLIIQCNYYADEAVNCEYLHLAATLAEFDHKYLIGLDPNTDHTHVFLRKLHNWLKICRLDKIWICWNTTDYLSF